MAVLVEEVAEPCPCVAERFRDDVVLVGSRILDQAVGTLVREAAL